jgi:hypothetical protein
MAFTAAQKKETDRLSAERKSELVLSKLEKHTPPQLKARVNIIGVSDTVNFAPENNYTAQEQAYIEAAQPRTKWMIAVPELLERATILEADGLTPTAIVEILRG